MTHVWGVLKPETVATLINFDPKNNAQGGLPPEQTMARTQTEGTAFLWNTLHEQGAALLADEVGMGKTFQALAICCLLWRSKPDARVLVMAPNGSICQHWGNEYRTFVKDHYQQVDLRVKAADQEPVHEVRLISHLQELCHPVITGPAFTLAKISSLSYLTKDADKEADLGSVASLEAIRIRENLAQQVGGTTPFDLVIIDEAQYFRTYGASTQRHHAAQGFFGAEVGSPLAEKFLLLTATPSHRSMNDVQNIMRYFAPKLAQHSPSQILNEVALRRLRLLQTESHGAFNKYQYREERVLPADFAGDVDAELFYALYQKKLVQNQRCSGRGYMYGYLEGFESMGRHEVETASEADSTDTAGTTESKAEYYQAADSEILTDLSRQYYEHYRNVPSHPKYRALVDELVCSNGYWDAGRCLLEDKHLVFVRRIPSVNELTQRVNEVYEKLFAERIISALLPAHSSQEELAGKLRKWQKDNYSRKAYSDLYQECRGGADLQAETPDEEAADTGDTEGDDEPSGYKCRVLDIFTTKKDKGSDSTHASRFRLRFGKETEVFSIFFEPAIDYLDGEYQDFNGIKSKKEYRKYARSARVESLNAQVAKSILEDAGPYAVESRLDNTNLPTLWSLCVKLLRTRNPLLLATLGELTEPEKESFARYVRSGLLFSSPALIELYAWYIEAAERHDARTGYEQYVAYVGNQLPDSVTYRLWCEALTTFKVYLNKIRGVAGKRLLDEHFWNCFTRPPQQPAWFVSGSTAGGTRENIRFAFNSPFFPNVLIATSVFQEGVNLHLNCRKVNHYGMAASAGDNEQRIGRVDRLFGHINRKLEEQQHNRLLISYPFLKGTFDEEQLASFLMTKDEIVSKMDECRQPEAEKYIQQVGGEDWTKFLHTPERFRNNQASTDPYPAGRNGWPAATYQPCEAIASPPFAAIVQEFMLACRSINGVNTELFQYPDQKQFQLFIDVRLRSGRQQPVIVEGHFNPLLMQLGGSGYYLRLKSPLADRDTTRGIEDALLQPLQQLSRRYPLPKLVLDDERQGWFYLHLAVDLPVLMKDGKTLLARDEIQLALEQLIYLTDELEATLFGDRDLGCERIVELGKLAPAAFDSGYSARAAEQHALDDGWHFLMAQDAPEQPAILAFRNLDRLFIGDWHIGAIANRKTPFINHLLFGEENHVGVCFPSVDFQPEEQALLGKVCEEMVVLEGLSDDRNPSIQAVVGLFTLLANQPVQKIVRTVWNQAYKQFRSLSVDIYPDRTRMRELVEAITVVLGMNVTVTIPFWRGGWATRTDLFGVLETVSERNTQIGLAIVHYNDGDGYFSSWEVIRRMSDKNLILAKVGHDNTLTRQQIRLEKLLVRNDHADLAPNTQRPYQIRPRECLLVTLAG